MTTILGTPISKQLAADIQRTVSQLKEDADQVPSSDIEDIVYRMTEESLRQQFVGTCEQLGLSSKLLKLVNMTVAGSLKTTRFGLKKVIPKLTDEQRMELADYLDDTVYEIAE